MVDLTLLNEIAQLQAHLDQINMTTSMWMSVGIVMIVIGAICLILTLIIAIKTPEYDNGFLIISFYTLLLIVLFAGIILTYRNWYDLTYTHPILENQIENLKAMAGI